MFFLSQPLWSKGFRAKAQLPYNARFYSTGRLKKEK